MEPSSRTNRLSAEKSPYLLKHARNPVDWYPWSDEAIRKAKNDGKPIFLSIGYFSCHWCSVMERESFENEETASFLNKHFISIKVDREERPDLDAYYMNAVQAMTGGGGWPMSVFLTPELKPFYGGTYFPPEPRGGMPSFRQVLEFVAKLWRDNRGEVSKNAEEVARAIVSEEKEGGTPGKETLAAGFEALAASFDSAHGGFGGAPKFPLPTYLEYLLRYNFRTGKELALTMAVRTLEEIAKGGVRDHVGGGFHRYSTDRRWLVPHFEKMLYDNALLSRAFLRAYSATGEEAFASAAREALDWMESELRAPGGAYYSALDADSEDGEGVYYTLTPDEVRSALGEKQAEAFCFIFGVTRTGNFDGRSIPTLAHTLPEASERYGIPVEKLERDTAAWKKGLLEWRRRRPRPAVDTKVIASWNGLAISALAQAGRTLAEPRYIASASRAASFLLRENVSEGALFRIYSGGEASVPGMLEDYAFLGEGLLELFEATGEPEMLKGAISLARKMVELFWDEGGGGFYVSSGGIPERQKDDHDGPTPSGNSSAAMLLTRLSAMTGDQSFREKAERTVRHFAARLDAEPAAHTYMLSALDLQLKGIREVVITSERPATAAKMIRTVDRTYLPDCVVLAVSGQSARSLETLTTLLEGRSPAGKAVAYVCENFTCKLPANDEAILAAQLAPNRR